MKNIAVVMLLVAAVSISRAGTDGDSVQDLTKVILEDTKKDFLLGPTGARGWMHVRSVQLTPQDITADMSTAFARQILVTAVEEGSPSEGVLEVGDVILGVGEKPFDGDPRKALADAINEAEKTEHKGILKLLRWRPDGPAKEDATERGPGTEDVVSLTLAVLGTYSDTAPYDCPKSEVLFKQTLDAVYREELGSNLGVWALALLATGEDKHIEKVRGHVKSIARPDLKLGFDALDGGKSWTWAYQIILLSEYHLMTGDESVLPAIKELAVTLSMGQSSTGTWGHYMAQPSYNGGRMHGRLEGYATLNQPSIACFMALVFAQKCGVEHPELTQALEKANEFYGYYIGKGAIPYGYDMPKDYLLTNNGTSATAGLAFSIKGDSNGARFFSRLCGSAAYTVETGHTGAFFNSMWTGLGANLGGPKLYQGYFRDWTWRRTMTRKWNGGYVFQRAGGGNGAYGRIGASSAMLLHLCLPRRALLITGRDQDESIWFNANEAAEVAGYPQIDYAKRTNEELLTLLGNDLPPVRLRAADELGKRDGDFVDELLPMLKGSRNQKIGSCHALARKKDKAAPAMDGLLSIIRDRKEDLWVRGRALYAISQVGEPAREHVPELLEMLVGDIPEDERRHLERHIAAAVIKLAEQPYQEKNDKELVYAAAKKLLGHPHMRGRMAGMMLLDDLPLEDFHIFADQIEHVIRNQDPDYYTYHYDRPAKLGLELMDRLNIEDAMELCVETIHPGIWGQRYRVGGNRGRLAFIQKFGANAKPYIPKLKEMKLGAGGDEAIKAIEESDVVRELITMDEAKAAGARVQAN